MMDLNGWIVCYISRKEMERKSLDDGDNHFVDSVKVIVDKL